MIVIIEGLDGTGKTTISKQIAEKYNFQYIHESYTDDCIEKQNRVTKMLERLFSGENYIYDRTTLIDDFVYSFLNKQPSSLVQFKQIILSILSQCHIVHLILDESIRQQRFSERGDQYVTDETVKQAAIEYGLFYADLDNVHYVEIGENNDQNMIKIMEEINND